MTRRALTRLALLYRLSQTFNSSLDLDEVLNRVMDEVIAATRAERGFVMLREADGRLVFRVARGMDQRTIDDPQFQISRSVVERVAREGQPVLTSDAQGREFGTERLRRAVADQCRSSAVNIVAALERAVHDFAGSTAPFDDVAIVAIKSLR